MHTKNWIGGEWTIGAGTAVAVYDPSDVSRLVGEVTFCTTAQVRDGCSAARQAQKSWDRIGAPRRAEYLWQAAAVMERRADDLARLASSEMGKPLTEMRGEVARGVSILRYFAAEGVRAIGQVIPSLQADVLQYTKRVPLGVVAVITPWNFPVAIPIWKIAPALIYGNTIVWKPAEIASLTATAVAEVFAEADLPAGVLNLLVGRGREVGDVLLGEGDLDGVSFTGSTGTGQYVASLCASRNVKYQTEMGGKNAAVILPDANVALALPAVLSGAYRSAGQKCTATSRIIVHQEIYEEFVGQLAQEVSRLTVGPAWESQAYLGPVASAAQQATVKQYERLAREQSHVLAEAAAPESPVGHYIPALLVAGVDSSHALVQEEIFGPIATVLRADDFDQAVQLCNSVTFGLTASVFTSNLSAAFQFMDRAESGMVRVNVETAGVEYQAPFGGMKMSSSHSREQGPAAADFYTQSKTCAVYYGGV